MKKLPKIISNVDINIIPIENNIFNSAKSENSWVESALVKVPSIASNYGEFQYAIIHNETGLLCSDNKEWYISLKTLIKNKDLRKTLGENAYNVCKYKYNTIYTGRKFANYINLIANKHIGFFLPSLQISEVIYIILKHACILKDIGWDVDLILPEIRINLFKFQDHNFNVISLNNDMMTVQYDVMVLLFVQHYLIFSNIIELKNIYILFMAMKLSFILMDIFLEVWLKMHIQYLVLNILQFQKCVKNGYGKNIEKKLDIHLMGLI